MADDGAEDNEDDDKDERIIWYDSDGVEDEGEEGGDASDSDVHNEGGDREGLCTDHTSINMNSTSEGLGSLHPPYGSIIKNCITHVFHTSTPKNWQLLLIQAIVFNKNTNKLRALYIRRTADGKSFPIQCAATMRRFVTIAIVPLLSVGLDQANNIHYSCDKQSSVYAEHLDSISEDRDIVQMRHFLNELKYKTASRVLIILYASPIITTSSRWCYIERFNCSEFD